LLKRNREIVLAAVTIAAVTALYAVAYQQAEAFPRASGVVGHWIGVVGFALMLTTETLYSIRKQVTSAAWGSMAAWLRFHVFTGLVGPYMVLLHTAMRFRGLAGVAMLLTVIVVVSGIVGRYMYTALPRTIERIEPTREGDLEKKAQRLVAQRRAMATWRSVHVPLTWALFAAAVVHVAAGLYYATLQR
jgi:hypothetical protein